MDQADPLRRYRERFLIPKRAGREVVYLTGNSLGCQPSAVRELLHQELEDWAELGVLGHELSLIHISKPSKPRVLHII